MVPRSISSTLRVRRVASSTTKKRNEFLLISLIFLYYSCHVFDFVSAKEILLRPRCDLGLHRNVDARLATKTNPNSIVYPEIVLKDDEIVWIPVVFHVAVGYSKKNPGFIPRDVILKQIENANSAFDGTQGEELGRDSRIRFLLSGINYYRSQKWFKSCQTYEYDFKTKTTLDRESVLNVWTCDMQLTSLGNAPFPVPGGRPQAWDQGVTLDHRSLPRINTKPNYKPFRNFDLGDSLVHEAGHYFGLFHTFQNFCDEPGDHIDDTPPEAGPYYSNCPSKSITRDTCPFDDEPDPIRNFMDYSMDSCMNHFTRLQIERMRDVLGAMRSNMARMAAPMRCTVMGGKPGTAIGMSSCREGKCKHTRMPNGKMPPSSGWCRGVGLSGPGLRKNKNIKSWGVCCCPNDPSCPSLSKSGFSNFVSRSTKKSSSGRLLEEDEEEEDEEGEVFVPFELDSAPTEICDENKENSSFSVAARVCALGGKRLCSLKELRLKANDSSTTSSCSQGDSYWTMSFCEDKKSRGGQAKVWFPSTNDVVCVPNNNEAHTSCCEI